MQEQAGVQLYFSNSVEELSAALAAVLKAHQPADVFESQTVIVPNANLQKWLQLRLADYNGIAANIDFPFLEKGLRELVDTLTGEEEEIMLGASEIQLMLIRYFKTADLHEIPSFMSYLTDKGLILPDRLWQLSGQMARLFLEYERNRPQMIRGWLENKLSFDDETASLEKEQSRIYREIFKDGEISHLNWKTLVQAASPLFDRKFQPCSYQKRNIYIFGPSQLSVFHRRLLCRLGRYFNISIFSLNVCAEFWEDTETPSETKWRLSKLKKMAASQTDEGELLPDVDDNPLLKSWGKPGREALKIFSDLEDECTGLEIPFESFWLPADVTGGKTVLKTIQSDILNRCSWRESEDLLQPDNSIQIAAAPGIYREVESVYSSILTNMQKNPALKLTDIAVLVPDMDRYKAAVSKVFDGQGEKYSRPVPYSLVDSKAKSDSLYARAVLSLLEIFEGEFTRKEVFGLFLNECFMEASGLTPGDINLWLKWADELNIYREFESLYDAEGNAGSMFTFKQGGRRLLLGRIMNINDSSFSGVVPYSAADKTDLAGSFLFYVEKLAELRAEFRNAELRASEWQEKFAAVQELFLKVPDNLNAELSVRTRLNESFADLRKMSEKALLLNLTTAEVSHFIKASLDGIPASKGAYLGSGVTIASLQPMRPVPFKIVYVLGLGENEFPGTKETSALDLRQKKRKIGDISIPEKNLYLFLETLICTREKLCLSYVSEDIRRDKKFNPSQIIMEILEYCNRNILKEKLSACTIPLKHADPHCFEKENRSHEWLQSSSPDHALLAVQTLPLKERGVWEQQLLETANIKIGTYLSESESSDSNIDITLSQLAAFLKNPASAVLKYHYGLSEYAEEDPALEEDEPFKADYLFKYNFTADFMNRYLEESFENEIPDAAALVDSMYRQMQLCSATPAALFGELDKAEMSAEIEKLMADCNAQKLINTLKTTGRELLRNPGFGNILSDNEEMVFDALQFKIRGWKVNLHGAFPYVCTYGGVITDLIVPHPGKIYNAFNDALLPAFLFWTAAKLKGVVADTVNVHLLAGRYRKGYYKVGLKLLTEYGDEEEYGFASDRDVAAWLQALMKDFIEGRLDMLPFSTAARTKIILDVPGEELLYKTKTQEESSIYIIPDRLLKPQHTADFFEEYREEVFYEKTRMFSSVYNRLLRIAEPEIPKDALIILRRRFKAFSTMVQRSGK